MDAKVVSIIFEVSISEDLKAIYILSIQQYAFAKGIFILSIDSFILIDKYITSSVKET